MSSDKQITANRQNAQKSTGAISEAGKEIIKHNALKHGILKSEMSAYEDLDIEEVKDELERDLKPVSVMEKFILERIAIHLVKLKRINKAEKEFIQSILHPDMPVIKFDTVGAYYPKMGHKDIESLVNVYQRYETTEENRMYRALDKLREVKTKD